MLLLDKSIPRRSLPPVTGKLTLAYSIEHLHSFQVFDK